MDWRNQAITRIGLEPVPHRGNRKAALGGYVRLIGERLPLFCVAEHHTKSDSLLPLSDLTGTSASRRERMRLPICSPQECNGDISPTPETRFASTKGKLHRNLVMSSGRSRPEEVEKAGMTWQK